MSLHALENSSSSKMDLSVLRLHNVYGPGAEYMESERAQAVPALIRKAIFYPQEPFEVWGTGTQYRDFVYIDDVVDALIASLTHRGFKGAVQIGTSEATDLRKVSELLSSLTKKCMNKDLPSTFNTNKRDGDQGRIAIIKKAKK
jgi:nucleoside-diphosphate-sugar epimerase